ncbi:hypothetical protein L596_018383 [Steinernema carpocapsae]|uniref:Uncharacterized protein n=1 Tax=Steinernema carpocapsae TaxID=34508 RepID=A0A4U5N4T8_STECR|nr:hypothetical protein L596_018383 [Steinernema carpocapsae]
MITNKEAIAFIAFWLKDYGVIQGLNADLFVHLALLNTTKITVTLGVNRRTVYHGKALFVLPNRFLAAEAASSVLPGRAQLRIDRDFAAARKQPPRFARAAFGSSSPLPAENPRRGLFVAAPSSPHLRSSPKGYSVRALLGC